MRIEDGVKLDYKDVLIVPQRSDIPSRTKVNLIRKFKFKHSRRILTGLPVIAANMDATGTMEMADALFKHKMFTALHKHYEPKQLVDFFSKYKDKRWKYTFYSLGIGDFDKLVNVRSIISDMDFPYLVNLDVANGMTEAFVQALKALRKLCPNSVIMAGNVVGANMAEHLILCGADIAKIGIGPGSCCQSRIKTGVGFPQLSAISGASFAAHGLKGHVCGDGGCTRVGDICKGLAAGGDFIMIGGLLAGTDECSGKWKYKGCYEMGLTSEYYKEHREEYKTGFIFYGMASEEAQEKYNGGLSNYKAVEGKSVTIPYKGPVENIIREIKGGLASACTYVGASKIKDLPKCASFVRCTQQENTVFNNE
ncbi:hypothetical protein LCGC14_1739080 [marine sediment metagenome]|uniref:GMP reductase n=1 Tax=marine sediment metagenome TaxID=412755 RepID=A0A0F9K6X8_9ZZZZ